MKAELQAMIARLLEMRDEASPYVKHCLIKARYAVEEAVEVLERVERREE